MNAKAYDIYQELITLPESKLAEIQPFIESVKHKNSNKPARQLGTATGLFTLHDDFKDYQ